MMNLLAERIKDLKLLCEGERGEDIQVELRRILGRVGVRQCISTEELEYLLELAGLEKRIALKMNKFV